MTGTDSGATGKEKHGKSQQVDMEFHVIGLNEDLEVFLLTPNMLPD